MRPLVILALILAGWATALSAAAGGAFKSIDGGLLAIEAWRGQPVLVVNTASRCGFTGQYEGLQALWERYRDRGLVVLGVPSNDFRQELASEGEVKQFCEVNFEVDFPMTAITHVRGEDAHEFFSGVKTETGFEPSWNFNKILIGPDGSVVATWGATTEPGSPELVRTIEALLD
jgi:glutathione peroxidase